MTTNAIVRLPKFVTDADYAFDFAFFDGSVSTPHNFAADDIATLDFVSRSSRIEKISLRTDDADPALSFIAANTIGLRIPESVAAEIVPSTYTYELRRIGSDGTIDLLALGTCAVQSGLSLDGTKSASSSSTDGFSNGSTSTANIIYQASQVQIVYPNSSPVSGPALIPRAAPVSPSSGWVIYVDKDDENKLKAKSYLGNVIEIGSP